MALLEHVVGRGVRHRRSEAAFSAHPQVSTFKTLPRTSTSLIVSYIQQRLHIRELKTFVS